MYSAKILNAVIGEECLLKILIEKKLVIYQMIRCSAW